VKKTRSEIVTFKVDASLLAAMKGVANRSEFIRGAILAALDSACPLCVGTGILSPRQKEHWEEFSRSHAVVECDECHEKRLVCSRVRPSRQHGRRKERRTGA